jgi:uncharacterized protein YjiS (DUF1127 family)
MEAVVFSLTQSTMSANSLDPGHGFLSNLLAVLIAWRREWSVRRQIACAQMLDGASLRDIGLAHSGVENAIRHGRKPGF